MLPVTLESVCNLVWLNLFYDLCSKYAILKPEISRTTGLYLYDHISLSVLIVPIGLKKWSHHITEKIIQTPVWAISHLSYMKQDVFQNQKISYREHVSDGLKLELDHLFLIILQDWVISVCYSHVRLLLLWCLFYCFPSCVTQSVTVSVPQILTLLKWKQVHVSHLRI